jgi:uncharacterized protein YoxC
VSAKPEVVGTIGDDDMVQMRVGTMDAIAATVNAQELEIKSLKRQREGLVAKNALLQEQVNEAQLQAAHQIALSKFAEALMYQRVLAVEKHVDQIANFVQRFADAPTREEFTILKNDYYSHSASCG